MDWRLLNTGFVHPLFLSSTSDNITGLTGQTPVITLYKNASTSSSSSTGTIAEATNGWYKITFTSNDANTAGMLVVHASATGGNPSDFLVRIGSVDPSSTSQAYTLTSTGAMTLATAQSYTMTAGGVLLDAGTSTGKITLSSGTVSLSTAQSFTMTGGSVLVSSGTGAGQLTLSSGTVSLSTAQSFTMTGGSVLLSSGTGVGQVVLSTGTIAITSNVKKNQALANFEFLMTDSTSHAPRTGLANIALTRSIDGGAFSTGTLSTAVEVANGIYRTDLAAGDLNGNVITLRATNSTGGADDRLVTLVTAP